MNMIINRSGKCALCKKDVSDLQESHIIPKLLYRYMRRYQDELNNINGLISNVPGSSKLDITQRQWKKLLFCRKCEGILSINETKFARILHDINKKTPQERSAEFFNTNIASMTIPPGVDALSVAKLYRGMYFDFESAEVLKYFSASYVLRQLYLIEHNLGAKEIDMLEKYVLNHGPGNFTLIVYLNKGNTFKSVCSSMAIDSLKDFKHYNFYLPEMWFHLIFDVRKVLDKSHVLIMSKDFEKEYSISLLLKEALKKFTLTDKAKKALQK
ncbi:hypothetical protein FXE31_14105 [Vibrio cholerae]|uniref:hypothetical protein n=1 Tax=Vibrio cholerae TaxID=666 RepID=UPI0011DBCFE0|nr:hypothetical protein [Vibrio cholerae]TYA80992.1 hypothetical protein FXE31_14105 [Vibrio cholerae]GHY44828.1 hypothetical protein VCSRO23_3385 [Vibrio cholerae]